MKQPKPSPVQPQPENSHKTAVGGLLDYHGHPKTRRMWKCIELIADLNSVDMILPVKFRALC